LYLRFVLSDGNVWELLAERKVNMTDERIPQRWQKFGYADTNESRCHRLRLGDRGRIAEVIIRNNDERCYLRLTVDQDGQPLDILVLSRHDKPTTKFLP
jgi:putative transposase